MKAIMTTQTAGNKTRQANNGKQLYRRACTWCDYHTEWFESYAELMPYKYCPCGCKEPEGVPLNISFAATKRC